ncbi:hypothetical protein ACFO6R_12795 [Eubacterium multiforme]|uniref:Multisubunit Na+/H+ antiporter MnhG subunit n=1 Tax=Eubacterium multiforme TaxID=83339 RepID=A0ABT9UW72_9FIRM|nr:hypothetical protein [Eubacterium multiforme]MDQ0150553.1 multisubunit Na+/H+ antiporter MnhG subunit [Eubacterium multiforme]
MKRLPEFVLGLIGSILSFFTAIGSKAILGKLPCTFELGNIMYSLSSFGIILAIASIVFASLINKYTKVSSICLIVLSSILFLTNFMQIIAFILMLIAGIMGLARKVNN